MCGVYHGCAVIRGPQKNGRHHVIGSPSRPRAPKSIDDDVIGCACAVMGLEDDSSVWSYPPAHTTLMVRRPSGVRPSSSVVHNAQRSSSPKLLDRSKPNLCGASLGRQNDILFATSGSHDQDGRHAHIW